MENQQKRDFRKLFADPFRNAKISQTHFAMRKFTNPNSQCENFAMPNAISQCRNRFRNANFNFAMRKFRNAKFRNAKCHFAMPILNLHCQFQFRNAKISQISNSQCENFAMRNFAMRNFAMPKPISHCENHCLCEIHPAKFTGLVILCN